MEKYLSQSEPAGSSLNQHPKGYTTNPWNKFVVPLRVKGGPGLSVEDIARRTCLKRSASHGMSTGSWDSSSGGGGVSPPSYSMSVGDPLKDALHVLKSTSMCFNLTPPASPDAADLAELKSKLNCEYLHQQRRKTLKKKSKKLSTDALSAVLTKEVTNSVSNLKSSKGQDSNNESDSDSPPSKKRIHRCNYNNCNKVYTKSSHLKAHQRTHTGTTHFSMFLLCQIHNPKVVGSSHTGDEISRSKRKGVGTTPDRSTTGTD